MDEAGAGGEEGEPVPDGGFAEYADQAYYGADEINWNMQPFMPNVLLLGQDRRMMEPLEFAVETIRWMGFGCGEKANGSIFEPFPAVSKKVAEDWLRRTDFGGYQATVASAPREHVQEVVLLVSRGDFEVTVDDTDVNWPIPTVVIPSGKGSGRKRTREIFRKKYKIGGYIEVVRRIEMEDGGEKTSEFVVHTARIAGFLFRGTLDKDGCTGSIFYVIAASKFGAALHVRRLPVTAPLPDP